MAEISFYSKDESAIEVLHLLQRKLPQHQIMGWPVPEKSVASLSYAICWHPPDDFFRNNCELKAIFSLAAGVDHLLQHPGLPESVPIVRLTDAGMGDKIAEYVHYGVLRAHRQFDIYRTQQRDACWQPQPDRHASDYKVGVLGCGVIGQTVAKRLHLAGYQVSAFKRNPMTHDLPFPVMWGEPRDFLRQLDVLVAVLPLTTETTGIIDSEFLAQLPAGAHFINVGRGDHVVEDDLLRALDSGQLSSALLDVCVDEPLPESHPFWRHKKVVITPHVAGPTQVDQSVGQIVESIKWLEAGGLIGDLDGLVDKSSGY
jgi:glyoxylate/hydroxypyruvate reductase A